MLKWMIEYSFVVLRSSFPATDDRRQTTDDGRQTKNPIRGKNLLKIATIITRGTKKCQPAKPLFFVNSVPHVAN